MGNGAIFPVRISRPLSHSGPPLGNPSSDSSQNQLWRRVAVDDKKVALETISGGQIMNKSFLGAKLLAILLVTLALACVVAPAQTYQVGSLQVPPGQKQSGFLKIPSGPDGETQVPVTVINGATRGPALALIAGNHGYEYPPILATQRLAAGIDPQKLRGRVVIVHVANLPSFLKRTIYYSPIDGKNLNRVYPGKLDGTLSERIAYVITREVIERTDTLIDLHCGDGNESLRPYGYWDPIGNAKVDEAAKKMVEAFGLNNIVIDRNRPADPKESKYCSNTAMTRGKPAITIESGGMGVASDEGEIAAIERGTLNVMRHLKMIDGAMEPPQQITWYDPAEVLYFPADSPTKGGLFTPKVQKTQMVEKGALLGVVTDYFGKQVYELHSPFAGEVLYIVATPPISAGEPLAFIGSIKK
jgi:predicted deacylase